MNIKVQTNILGLGFVFTKATEGGHKICGSLEKEDYASKTYILELGLVCTFNRHKYMTIEPFTFLG